VPRDDRHKLAALYDRLAGRDEGGIIPPDANLHIDRTPKDWWTMAKQPQDVFRNPNDQLDSIVKPLVPRIEVALTVPDGVDVQITINGVGVLMRDDEE
jgi:hypothetical protein